MDKEGNGIHQNPHAVLSTNGKDDGLGELGGGVEGWLEGCWCVGGGGVGRCV